MYRSSNLNEERKIFVEKSRNKLLVNYLYDAVLDGEITTVGYLLEEKKVNPNCVLEKYDAAPLHTATGIGLEDVALQIVQLLLTYGADPNIQTSDGTSPLMIACIFGRPRVAKLLLRYGGNPLLNDTDGMRAIDYAFANGYQMQEILGNDNVDWSILETSDGSLTENNNLTRCFYSIFNDDSFKFNPREKKYVFSDIESDAECVEICDLDTAFCVSGSSNSSSDAETFVSFANVDFDCDNQNGYLKENEEPSKILNISDIHCSGPSTKSSGSLESAISYRTDRIKWELERNGIAHGPLTPTTKKVYYNLIKKVLKGKRKGPFDVDEFSKFPDVLQSTFKSNFKEIILKWTNLENLLSKNFSDTNKLWRGGKEKQFFTYLLLDPFITDNISLRKHEVHELDIWKSFILSIFYVGKGKNSRPFSHLFEALKNNLKKTTSKKILRIQNIWGRSAGVVCLHIFHNVISAEAHTHEAAMIDAVGLRNLTNIQSGEYYGIVKNWSLKQKQQLGVLLLHKALQIYLAEGERQIRPADLK